ncbi:inositol 1,4,5-triphosphate receptor associated 2 isoform X1 [Takifugu rubripes]|uniref:Lymphoid-restricted membrane protein n=1 Tax=Takifugu rubripes TaxID=31033 RepID=A0A674MZL5_TAKRU|nr:lymphoid-restricted membrane protein isoform X1 [Takifugu rubripes]
MDECTPQPSRRHNPVDSICRKLQTIQWRGERAPNSPFQIPKFSSSSYDSPQCGLRHNVEAILKKGGRCRGEGEGGREEAVRGVGTQSSAATQKTHLSTSIPRCTNPPTPANVTYTIMSTLGERRGADGSDGKQAKMWQRYCSTPTARSKDSPSFAFPRGQQPGQRQSGTPTRSPPLSRTFTPQHGAFSLNFCSAEQGNATECELPYPALVVKRLSLGDGVTSESRRENMAEISLICEENLLDTIFFACDTQRRGRVYVSHIVDYLRHTTSRSSEDSGLEELCNMLDPEHKDVSIDLDTYHAVMREWIDDCRNNGEEEPSDVTQESVKLKESLSAKRSVLLNMTSGSLEAFGGDVSRAEFETSELVYCVADLQMSNQKLQEEVKKMKQVLEGMEDSHQKLAEENEELRNKAKVSQQLVQKEKMLKEEVEEMKATLSCTQEGRARASAHSKHVERENQSLIAKIASLQEENFKVTMEMEGLQQRITELCDVNADLQLQIHSFDAVISEKAAAIQEKSRQINELEAAVEEYSSITELLRADKSKLENQMQMLQPNLAGAGLSLSLAYRLNQSASGSLQTELALAQSPLEVPHGVDHQSANVSFASPLDETLDKEVLLMLQGPSPEHMAREFRRLLDEMKRDFAEESAAVLSAVRDLPPQGDAGAHLQQVQAELDARRADWALNLDQLAQYTDSLEKELIKMAGNMRRSRTEILYLSVRVQEQENQKRQLCEELEQLKAPQDSREASCQTPASEEEVGDTRSQEDSRPHASPVGRLSKDPGEDLDWDEEFALQDFLKRELVERNCKEPGGNQDASRETADKLPERGEEEDGEEKWMVVETAGEGEVRDTSTPLSARPEEAQPGLPGGEDSVFLNKVEPEENPEAVQEVTTVPSKTPSTSDITHSEASPPETSPPEASPPDSGGHSLSDVSDHAQNSAPADSPPATAEMLPPESSSPGSGETVTRGESAQLEQKEDEATLKSGAMNSSKSLTQDQLVDRSAEDSACLLPVLAEEEEESILDSAVDVPTGPGSVEETEQSGGTGAPALSNSSSSQPQPSVTQASMTSDPSQSEDSTAKPDSLPPSGKNKRELEQSHDMHAVEENKVQENQRESAAAAGKEPETSGTADNGDSLKDKNSLSANDKEIEAEFQRLALGFKCDMFTLEKRLRLEERSRDLAEENVRREVFSCQGLLQALIPLCEDDNQSMEIIQRLQKNLDILIQAMTRVSSRSEMLGAIHQESRIGKAVEVMIQHVENLRRVYTKEHAELLELRETLMQNERSFGSHTERDDFRNKKQPASQYYKSSSRRVSIAAIPRSGGNMHFDMSKAQECPDGEMERLTRRSPWNAAGKNSARPPLKRFVSSAAWVDTEEPSVVMKGTACDSTDGQSEEEPKENPVAETRRSSLSELGSKLTSLILPLKIPSPSSTSSCADAGMVQSLSHSLTSSRAAAAVARGGRGLWLWLAIVVVLAGLLALLASLVMQPVVDAAPVGTGDSWMTIQQLLWPYAGLRHNGQPPV